MQDDRRLKFTTDSPMPLFVCKFIDSVNLQGGSFRYIKIPHNLPYTPLLVGQWDTDPEFNSSHDITNASYQSELANLLVYTDSTYIYFNYYSTEDVTVYYRLWGFCPPDYEGDLDPVSDDSKFMFNTDYEYLKTLKMGKVTPGDSTTIQHNLGYVPLARVWRTSQYGQGQGQTVTGLGLDISSSNGAGDKISIVDENNLYIGDLDQDGYAYYHIYTNEA